MPGRGDLGDWLGSGRPVMYCKARCADGGINGGEYWSCLSEKSPSSVSVSSWSSDSELSSASKALRKAACSALAAAAFCLRFSSASRMRASKRATELNLSSSVVPAGMFCAWCIWKARSKMVSRGPGGELDSAMEDG